MNEQHPSSVAGVFENSALLRKGRADVFKIRQRTKMKRILRAILIVGAVDAFLWYRFANDNPLKLPGLPPDWQFYLPPLLLVVAVMLMIAMPLFSGRSPHITVYPEQVETGLTDLKGLDNQVDEVVRTLDTFLGYSTFREELGGTPRRGILFEGPPGTGKTYLAKAMAKQAGVPFLFIAAPALQSHWYGMTAYRIRSFFKALRKAARKEGGAIGFLEEIDAIGSDRSGGLGMSPAPQGLLGRATSPMVAAGAGGIVNELLIQMQSFDQPRLRTRLRARLTGWVNGYLPQNWQIAQKPLPYNNLLLIAATNRGDTLDPALLRPGRFDRRLYFDVPTKQERVDLLDFFLARKAHHEQLDDPAVRDKVAHETFSYTPVMIEHLLDEALLVALRGGRRAMNMNDILEAKLTDEIGIKQPVVYTDTDRTAVATHEAGHATVAYFLGKDRRMDVLSIIKRRGSLGLLSHGDIEEKFTRTKSELESAIAIALGGMVGEEITIGETGTGPGSDLSYATSLAAQMVGSFGMAGSLISYEAVQEGAISRSNLVAKVLGDAKGKERVEDILLAQRERVRAVLAENHDVHVALTAALVDRDELVGEEILEVIEKALANRN